MLGGTGTSANGKSAVFKFSMAGVSGLNITYASRTSNTLGFTTHTWQYSTIGVDWKDITGGAITGFTSGLLLSPFTDSFAAVPAMTRWPLR